MTEARKDFISWEEFFMGAAQLAALRSKDPSTQVGSCIVTPQNKIVSTGYNGPPAGVPSDDIPWDREGSFVNTKYPYVCHSELNSILNASVPLDGCRIYVSLFPCHECAKAIIQSGIKEVIYISDKYFGTDSNRASKFLLEKARVSYRKFVSDLGGLSIDFN